MKKLTEYTYAHILRVPVHTPWPSVFVRCGSTSPQSKQKEGLSQVHRLILDTGSNADPRGSGSTLLAVSQRS